MAKRRKKLRRRLYTFGQLEARLMRATRGREGLAVQLYGNVLAKAGSNTIGIVYRNSGGAAHLASVYRMSDGDTGYAVHGFGRAANKGTEKALYHYWKRYVSVFTPWDQRERLLDGRAKFYRLHDGEAVEIGGAVNVIPHCCEPPGASLAYGRWEPTKPSKWLSDPKFVSYPKFLGRSLSFYRSLQRRLRGGLPATVQLGFCGNVLMNGRQRRVHDVFPYGVDGLPLVVSTPPTRTQSGRMLYVFTRMHDNYSRSVLKISQDYGLAHSHVMAIEHGKFSTADHMHWKSTRAALVGIHEWVNGTLYIPGPSH